jgi:hypothetical protein
MQANTTEIADISSIKCKNLKFKFFYSSNRLFDLESIFTVGLVAARFSKLDLMLICFDDFFRT